MKFKRLGLIITFAIIGTFLIVANFGNESSFNFLKKMHKHNVKISNIIPEILIDGIELSESEQIRQAKLNERREKHLKGKIINDEELEDDWEDWKELCQKQYESEEEELHRFKIWKKKFLAMEKNNYHNKDYIEKANCFMDQTKAEFDSHEGGIHIDDGDLERHDEIARVHNKILQKEIHTQQVPQYVSWAKSIDLTVRHQECGDCWAQAATTALEALWQILGNKKEEFSVQESIDCVYNKTRSGCDGGMMNKAYEYSKTYGVVPVQNDPYEGKYNSKDECQNDNKYKSSNKKFVTGHLQIQGCDQLKAAVAKQPVTVGMLAEDTFQNAGKGIVPLKTVARNELNHALTVVGYTPEYWVIQNSWGNTWGYYGYARMAMGNNLGICNTIMYPISDQTYKIKPTTNKFEFTSEFQSKNTPPGIDLMKYVGARFTIIGANIQTTYKNNKGETLKNLDLTKIIFPQGKDKTDFNFFRISFIFSDKNTKKPFEIIFELSKYGLLNSNNIQGDTFYLGQCGINDDYLGDICSKYNHKTIFIWAAEALIILQIG